VQCLRRCSSTKRGWRDITRTKCGWRLRCWFSGGSRDTHCALVPDKMDNTVHGERSMKYKRDNNIMYGQ
jgi:hypothetical protein